MKEDVDIRQLPDEIPQPLRNHLYALRGALACAVLEHCLSLRCGVTYGVPDDERKKEKRVAVPYEAADVPSKKNEYSQPDVSILLSFLAYYNEGLDEEEFEEMLRKLKSLNMSTQSSVFEGWKDSISREERLRLEVKNVKEIKIESVSQRKHLFEIFRKNR